MNTATLTYPPDSVQCVSGDYLISRTAAGIWRVFHVEELVLLSRLVPLKFPGGIEFLEERHVLESQAPAYFREIYLLLTGYALDFQNADQALSAITSGALSAPIESLCKPITKFTLQNTIVHSRSDR